MQSLFFAIIKSPTAFPMCKPSLATNVHSNSTITHNTHSNSTLHGDIHKTEMTKLKGVSKERNPCRRCQRDRGIYCRQRPFAGVVWSIITVSLDGIHACNERKQAYKIFGRAIPGSIVLECQLWNVQFFEISIHDARRVEIMPGDKQIIDSVLCVFA